MTPEQLNGSVGIVRPEEFVFRDGLKLSCGRFLESVCIRYETYGTLSPEKNNAILVQHALTGDAHAAGYHSGEDKKTGWWDSFIGPGKYIDTNKYFVVCSNDIGGCSGSTGPSSVNPETGERYCMDFPVITIEDMVNAQKRLMDHLGIRKWLAVVGGSMGGMAAIQWGLSYPDCMDCLAAIATTSRSSPQSIAFNWVGREAIMSDSGWKNGKYEEQPQTGLSIARMLAHITYLSEESMRRKFGRKLQSSADYSFVFGKDFSVESYLEHQGLRFVERFDANSYLYITRALDYFDVSAAYDGNLAAAFRKVKYPFLVVSFSSDWLFPPEQSRELVKALLQNNIPVTYCNVKSVYGHDAFLLEENVLGPILRDFVDNVSRERTEER